jgi:hypothetical protein
MHFHYDNIRLNLSMFDSKNHQASSAVLQRGQQGDRSLRDWVRKPWDTPNTISDGKLEKGPSYAADYA